jgi:hypothetical protein
VPAGDVNDRGPNVDRGRRETDAIDDVGKHVIVIDVS